MNHKIILILLIIFSNVYFSQTKLIKDIDFDGKKHTICIDNGSSQIESSLSTQKFKKVKSGEIEYTDGKISLVSTAKGFELHVDWMRAGYACQFRYNKLEKKIQLIGMNRYEYGTASNDGSGKSSVNLLTGQYIGNWNLYDVKNQELIKIKTIKAKISFPKTFLESFNEDIVNKYIETCVKLYEMQRKKYG